MKKLTLIIFSLLILTPLVTSAHQPRLVNQSEIIVDQPEISKAYYGELKGESNIFKIKSDKSFNLYVGVLVPDIQNQKKDVSAIIIKNGDTNNPITTLDGPNFTWTKFWEPFGRDWYWKGPEYKTQAESGDYTIIISSPSNDSRYSLAIGEDENFNFQETINAINIIPRLKSNFFNESPAGFILSIFGVSYLVIIFLLAFLIGFVYRAILRKVAKGTPRGLTNNISKSDRWVRAGLGLILLAWAILTTWNPLSLFFSGFCFFEAIFSWCGLYAALGKNTCPIA